jgi:hypothetical protein
MKTELEQLRGEQCWKGEPDDDDWLTVPFASVAVLPVSKSIPRILASVVPVACNSPRTVMLTSLT